MGVPLRSRMMCFHSGFADSEVANETNVGTADCCTDGGRSWLRGADVWAVSEAAYPPSCVGQMCVPNVHPHCHLQSWSQAFIVPHFPAVSEAVAIL